MKVKVIEKDFINGGEWTEPFVGELSGYVRGAENRPYAVIIHPDGRFLMVGLRLLRRVE